MPLTDKQIIEKFKIRSSDKILDVGGSMKQHPEITIDTLIDIIRPEDAPYGRSKLKARNFVRLDVTIEKFPFKDKQFDFCICTHTLEDLTTPFLAIDEMSRVAKRGLIITPSMGIDMVFSHLNFTDWLTGARRVPGLGHHKWFFTNKSGKMAIIPKNYPLLYSSEFRFVKWLGEEEFIYYWEGKIDYQEVRDLDFHKLIGEYRKFVRTNQSRLHKGLVLFYLDNPFYSLKEFFKLLLRKGEGFRSKIS